MVDRQISGLQIMYLPTGRKMLRCSVELLAELQPGWSLAKWLYYFLAVHTFHSLVKFVQDRFWKIAPFLLETLRQIRGRSRRRVRSGSGDG